MSNILVQTVELSAGGTYPSITNELIVAGTRTDKAGRFKFGTRYNLHLVYYANLSWGFHLPFGKYWNGKLLITPEANTPRLLRVTDDWNGEHSFLLGDVRLSGSEIERVK